MSTGTREFRTIGVVGLGTMGAGIAEVFARHGYDVVGVEVDDEGVARGRQHLESSTARAVKRGKLTEDEQAELLGRVSFATSLSGLEGRRPRRRGGRGVAVGEEADLRRPRGRRGPRRRDRHQHLLAVGHRDLHGQREPGPGRRRALLQPRPGAGLRRGGPHGGDGPRRRRGRLRAGAHAGQEPRRVRRQGRLHRQHAAVRLPQPRRVDVREPLRLPRGHRRRDALRLRLPDGPAGPARPDRPRHGVRDPRDDVPPGSRPAPRARPDPQADGHRGPAGPQVRSRLLLLRGRRQPRRGPRRQHALGRRRPRAQARHPACRRGRHGHHGHRHRRGDGQGGVRRDLRRPQPGQGRRGHPHHRALARQGDPARQARGVGQGRRAGPADRVDLAGRPRRRRHRHRGDRGGPQGQDHAVREPRRDLQARRDPGHDDVLVADHRVRLGHGPAPGRRSACTSSTPRRS